MEIIDIVTYSAIGVCVLLFIVALAITNFAGQNLITQYKENEKNIVDYMTPSSFAENVSRGEFNGKVRWNVCKGFLTDHYNGASNIISLSERTIKSASVSSFSVTAHELGHAIQYRDNPEKMAKFNKKRLLSKFFAKFTVPFFLAGIVLVFFSLIACICFLAISLLFFMFGLFVQLNTIKIEKEASNNAIVLLEKYADFNDYQTKQAKLVLKSAGLTYVASFLKSVLSWTMLVKKYDFY